METDLDIEAACILRRGGLWTVMITEKLQCCVPFPRNVNLAGIVYFQPGENHFVSNIVMEDNQVWYYDGLINGQMATWIDRPVTVPSKRWR